MAEELEPAEPGKQDMIDRKAAWIERMFDRLFGAIQKNPYATIAVISIAMNIWQFNIGTDKDAARILDITQLNEKVNKAIEARVEQKVSEKMAPIQAQQEDQNKKLDTSLNKFDNTMKAVKELVTSKNKKK